MTNITSINTTNPSRASKEPLNIDLGGNEFKILSRANISPELKKVIEDNLTPCMASYDGKEHQYEPSELAEIIAGNEAISSTLSEHDMNVVDALNSHYDFIEI